MKCWEYVIFTADSAYELKPGLLTYGRERFELVSVVTEPVEGELPQYVAIMKRPYDPYDPNYGGRYRE